MGKDSSPESGLLTRTDEKIREPKLYKVLLHNDHYTTMDFVVEVLVNVFHKTASEATKIMMEVHNKGMGIAGVYTYDIAMTKIEAVHTLAKSSGYPLRCSAEEA